MKTFSEGVPGWGVKSWLSQVRNLWGICFFISEEHFQIVWLYSTHDWETAQLPAFLNSATSKKLLSFKVKYRQDLIFYGFLICFWNWIKFNFLNKWQWNISIAWHTVIYIICYLNFRKIKHGRSKHWSQ